MQSPHEKMPSQYLVAKISSSMIPGEFEERPIVGPFALAQGTPDEHVLHNLRTDLDILENEQDTDLLIEGTVFILILRKKRSNLCIS